MSKRPWILVVVLIPQGIPFGDQTRLAACETGTLRDAAYDEPRDTHRLCVISKRDDPNALDIARRLDTWLNEAGQGLNLEVTSVPVDDPNLRWADCGIPSAPPSCPVVVLAGRRTFDRKSFFIDHWEPAPTQTDLDLLRTSPLRRTIQQEVGRYLALLLYVPGQGPGSDPNSVRHVLESVTQAWAKKVPVGLKIIEADRADPQERLLLSFAGVRPVGPDWVAVVFGKGKLTPPLSGSEITEARLNDLIQPLVGECTCMRSPASLGVDLPMVWNSTTDQSVVRLRTLWSPTTQTAATQPVAATGSPPLSHLLLKRTLYTLAPLAILVILVSAILARRRTRMP